MQKRGAAAWLAVVVVFAVLAAVASGAPVAREEQRLDASIRYLQAVQNPDGGFGGFAGGGSDPIFTSWAALALASAGINPRDQKLPGGTDAISYLIAHLDELVQTTDFERTLLVAVAAGMEGRAFGGRDLVTPVVARQLPDGSFPQVAGGDRGAINATAFAILALSLVEDPTLKPVIARAAAYLTGPGVQNENGSWDWVAGAPGSSDMTAAVIEALRAAGIARTDAERRGFAYIATTQNADGGFGMSPGDTSNSMSTAWVLQAMWSAQNDPNTWVQPGGTPYDYLASMQQPDGSVRYKADSDMNRIWSTAQVAPALAGRQLPILPVGRAEAPAAQPEPAEPTPERKDELGTGEGGQRGTAPKPGTGVIYGGGAEGAPLFSQPEPEGEAAPAEPERRRDDASSGAGRARQEARRGDARDGASGGAGLAEPPPGAAPGPAAPEPVTGTLVGVSAEEIDPAPSLQNAGGEPDAPSALILVGLLGVAGAFGVGREARRRPWTEDG